MRKLREKQRQASRQGELLLPLPGGAVTPVTDDAAPVTRVTDDRREEGAKPPEIRSESAIALKDENAANENSSGRADGALSAADAAVQADKRAKRINMVRGLRDWCSWSPHATGDDKDVETTLMLARAEAAAPDLEAWRGRPPADKAWFDTLHARAKAHPLDEPTKGMLRAARRPGRRDPGFGFEQIMARAGWVHGKSAAA
jgi:hypothetical protein